MVLFLLGAVRVAASECDQLQNASSDELASYVNKIVPEYGNAECIAFAINMLGNQRYEPAIPAMTQLLDFRWPLHGRPKGQAFAPSHGGTGIYPATIALQKFGKKAVPGLLEAIKGDLTSRTAREAAVFVLMGIYKNESPKAVALLKQGADTARDNATRQRLGRAAYRALIWCSPSDKAECKAAAETRYSN